MKKAVIFFSSLLFLSSCGKVKQIDTTEFYKLRDQNSIRYITEADFLEKASETGDKIKEILDRNLQNENCNDTLNIDDHEIVLYNTSEIDSDIVSEENLIGQLLEAVKYATENGQTVDPNIQKLGKEAFAFSFILDEKSPYRIECNRDFAIATIKKSELVHLFRPTPK